MEDAHQPQQDIEKIPKRLSLFRRSKGLSSRSPTQEIPEPTEVKKARFSLFRSSGRRSGVVLNPELFRPEPVSSPSSASSSEASSGVRTSSEGSGGRGEDVTDERNRALSILEGRVRPESVTGTRSETPAANRDTRTDSLSTTTPAGTVPVPASFIGALSMAVVSGRSRPDSMGSRRSLSTDGRRVSSRLGLVPEDNTVRTTRLAEEPEVDEHGLPTYASAVYPSRPVTYRFTQAGPFAMTLAAGEEEEVAGLGRYHVSVGVNVWAPRSCVTSVRRGLTDDGPLIALIESGCSTLPPTITVGGASKPLKDVMSKSLANGSRMYYVGDGTAIFWKLGRAQWKAYFDSAHLATFAPNSPRTMVVQPLAHKYLDHLLIAALLLMREKDESMHSRSSSGGILLPPLS